MTLFEEMNAKFKQDNEALEKADSDIKRLFFNFMAFFRKKAGITDKNSFSYINNSEKEFYVEDLTNYDEYEKVYDSIVFNTDSIDIMSIYFGIIIKDSDIRKVFTVKLNGFYKNGEYFIWVDGLDLYGENVPDKTNGLSMKSIDDEEKFQVLYDLLSVAIKNRLDEINLSTTDEYFISFLDI